MANSSQSKPFAFECKNHLAFSDESLAKVAWTTDQKPDGKTILDKDVYGTLYESGVLEYNKLRPPMINRCKMIDDEMAVDLAIKMLGFNIDYRDGSYLIEYPENHPKARVPIWKKIGKDEAGMEIWGPSETETKPIGMHSTCKAEFDAFVTDVGRRICRFYLMDDSGKKLFVDHEIHIDDFKAAFRAICWRKS